MRPTEFADSALIVLAHGTSEDPESGQVLEQHAAELRRRALFAEVRTAFWKQEPRLAAVLGETSAPSVFIAPFFFSAGYFCEQVIPTALGLNPPRPQGGAWAGFAEKGRRIVYCEAVGTHGSLAALAAERAEQVLKEFPFPREPRLHDVELVIAAHGTPRDENSSRSAQQAASEIRQRGLFGGVHALYLEQEPRIRRLGEVVSARHAAVVPFFVGEGPHVKEDVPKELGAVERVLRERLGNGQWPWRNPTEVQGKLVWYARPVGTHPGMVDVIVDRVTEAAMKMRV